MPRKPPAAALMASPDDIEAQFYDALQTGDLEKLMAVWADDDEIVCVHPGGPRVVGAPAIRASFEAIFSNGSIPARPQKIRRVESAGCAVHCVLEAIEVTTTDGAQTGWVIATNVYLKGALGWRLVAHHASPGVAGGTLEVGPEAPATLH